MELVCVVAIIALVAIVAIVFKAKFSAKVDPKGIALVVESDEA